jgi:hypothetical protein
MPLPLFDEMLRSPTREVRGEAGEIQGTCGGVGACSLSLAVNSQFPTPNSHESWIAAFFTWARS